MIFSKIILILSLIFGFGHQTAPIAVSTPVPAIIEAPKGVVLGEGKASLPERLGQASVTPSTDGLPPATTTSFINPNQSFMDVHEPDDNTIVPEEKLQPEELPVEPDGNTLPDGTSRFNYQATKTY